MQQSLVAFRQAFGQLTFYPGAVKLSFAYYGLFSLFAVNEYFAMQLLMILAYGGVLGDATRSKTGFSNYYLFPRAAHVALASIIINAFLLSLSPILGLALFGQLKTLDLISTSLFLAGLTLCTQMLGFYRDSGLASVCLLIFLILLIVFLNDVRPEIPIWMSLAVFLLSLLALPLTIWRSLTERELKIDRGTDRMRFGSYSFYMDKKNDPVAWREFNIAVLSSFVLRLSQKLQVLKPAYNLLDTASIITPVLSMLVVVVLMCITILDSYLGFNGSLTVTCLLPALLLIGLPYSMEVIQSRSRLPGLWLRDWSKNRADFMKKIARIHCVRIFMAMLLWFFAIVFVLMFFDSEGRWSGLLYSAILYLPFALVFNFGIDLLLENPGSLWRTAFILFNILVIVLCCVFSLFLGILSVVVSAFVLTLAFYLIRFWIQQDVELV